MLSDLTERSLRSDAYGDQPFSFLDSAAQTDLANITAIDLIENGDRTARENWQKRQLTNLLRHAQSRSKFWQKRMPSRLASHDFLKHMPVQTREDIAAQVKLEGSIMAGDRNGSIMNYSSTGSTGTPVQVYASQQNGYYNNIRSLAQYFINHLSLEENRVFIGPATSLEKLSRNSLDVKTVDCWAGPLSGVFRNGPAKKIVHSHDDEALLKELLQERVGYLVCANRYIDILINTGGIKLVKKLGIRLWLHVSDYRDPAIVKTLADIGIPCLSNYSAGEIGPIAFECRKHPGCFHIAHTNVIVETDNHLTAWHNGALLERLLITHLHSYATPIIRYDIGDFGQLMQRCRCGHDGPTVSNIFGRGKHFLRHPDGRMLPFYLSTRMLLEAVDFEECRFRQDQIDTITVEIAGQDKLTTEQEARLRALILKVTDPIFKIELKSVRKIDWSSNPKRLFFSSSVA